MMSTITVNVTAQGNISTLTIEFMKTIAYTPPSKTYETIIQSSIGQQQNNATNHGSTDIRK